VETRLDIVERLRRDLMVISYDDIEAMVREAASEIERLRAALQSLTHDPPQSLAREPDTDCEVVLKMREIARRALEPKP
jgi:hypothetical protein